VLARIMSDPRADAVQELVCFILLPDSGLQGVEPLQSDATIRSVVWRIDCLQREALLSKLLAICRPPFQVCCHGAVKRDTWENCKVAQRAFAWHC